MRLVFFGETCRTELVVVKDNIFNKFEGSDHPALIGRNGALQISAWDHHSLIDGLFGTLGSTSRIPATRYCDFTTVTAFLWKENPRARFSYKSCQRIFREDIQANLYSITSSEKRVEYRAVIMSMNLRKALRTILKPFGRTRRDTKITNESMKMRRLLLMRW